MALKIYDTLTPQGNYPAAKAEHIEMPDGSRLSEFKPVSSWNDLTDKPFGEADAFEPIIYDPTKQESYESVDLYGDIFYRVSDATPIGNAIRAATVYWGGETAKLKPITDESIPSDVCFCVADGPKDPDPDVVDPIFRVYVAVVYQEYLGHTGTYVCTWTPFGLFEEVPLTIRNAAVKTIDPKYLPDDAPEIKAAESGAVLEPGVWYEFGEVGELNATLAQKNDGKAHEFVLMFTPLAGFDKPVIVPEPVWLGKPQFPAGEVCVVSVLNGLAVSGHGSII